MTAFGGARGDAPSLSNLNNFDAVLEKTVHGSFAMTSDGAPIWQILGPPLTKLSSDRSKIGIIDFVKDF